MCNNYERGFMITVKDYLLISISVFVLLSGALNAQIKKPDDLSINGTYNLAGERSHDNQYYIMKTKVITRSPDGKRTSLQVLNLHLKCIPGGENNTGDKYICTEFKIISGDTAEISIPSLKGWSYIFKNGVNEKGEVLGIDHSKFANLTDDRGKPIPQDKSYFIYNSFIDFHTFCNVFSERTTDGGGIQDLKKIGDEVVHQSANSRPSVDLGGSIEKGSYFQNGEIKLLFKGLSVVDENECALVGYDSGESSFHMIMKPSPDMEIVTDGGSHYFGDLYIDLKSFWVKRAVMDELVESETKLPFPPGKINSIAERHIVIKNVSEKEFNED